jgi:hypothetical protein
VWVRLVQITAQSKKPVKSRKRRFDAVGMSTTTNANELIAVIDDCRAKGCDVKAIRKQKYDPCNFYMTRCDGKQVGPVKCTGNTEELNRKFGEAISYLNGTKNHPGKRAMAA